MNALHPLDLPAEPLQEYPEEEKAFIIPTEKSSVIASASIPADPVEHGLRVLYRCLLSTPFFGVVQQTFFRGNVTCADVMLETDRSKIRKVEVADLKAFVRKYLDPLRSFHFGCEYNQPIHRERIMTHGFAPAFRVLSLDIDSAMSVEPFWKQQAFMTCLLANAVLRRFMPAEATERHVLVCFTGGGWHVYFACARLAKSQARWAIVENISRASLFATERGGGSNPRFRRDREGFLQLPFGCEWVDGDLLHRRVDEAPDVVWKSREDIALLVDNLGYFLRDTQGRHREWLGEKGPIVSVLRSVRHIPHTLDVKERLDGLVREVREGRVRLMGPLFSSLSRISQFENMQARRSCVADAAWLKGAVMYACISHDCFVSGYHVDQNCGQMQQMLRGPLSAKVRASGGCFLSYPIGNLSEVLQATYKEAVVRVTDLSDTYDIEKQPILKKGLVRFYAWARLMRRSTNRGRDAEDND
ncbi:hypothetical protein GUITHDRAFT_118922 [Guillardia theta CCMP2712]|uniref:Uncharacterized protein n=1 Tax=Guillardia theta (strain CCMP2712) TaxID=905079 RepID=L1IFP0_GUITC|nr:hypothetical protein GUITHDRAFT_118922 [Guillardia theta CCMP2712]EKX34882.1 hypothetical protein GUITHDRAFT_118922 [Guillardia theta CCMP2712]|eukprot:XP_005821862.1 hypothetical protein GUITHDRAFT_118922 [Guillardia theta CCMP2712]